MEIEPYQGAILNGVYQGNTWKLKAYVVRDLPANVLLGSNFLDMVKTLHVQQGIVELTNGALIRTLAMKADANKAAGNEVAKANTSGPMSILKKEDADGDVKKHVNWKDVKVDKASTTSEDDNGKATVRTGLVPPKIYVRPTRAVTIPPNTARDITVGVEEANINFVTTSKVFKKGAVLEPVNRRTGMVARVFVEPRKDGAVFTTRVVNMSEDALHLSKESLVGRLEAVDRVVAQYDERGVKVAEGDGEVVNGSAQGRPNQSCHC
jgi:hypothetical protein